MAATVQKRDRPSSEMRICLSGLKVKLHIHIYATILLWLCLLSQCLCMIHTTVARRTACSYTSVCCCLMDATLQRTRALTQLLKHEYFIAYNWCSTLVFFYLRLILNDSMILWRTETVIKRTSVMKQIWRWLYIKSIWLSSYFLDLTHAFNTCVWCQIDCLVTL